MNQKRLKRILIELAIFVVPFLLVNILLIFAFKMDAGSIWTVILAATVAYLIAEVFKAKVWKELKKK